MQNKRGFIITANGRDYYVEAYTYHIALDMVKRDTDVSNATCLNPMGVNLS